MVRTDANTNSHRRAQKVRTGAGVFRPAPVGTCPAPAVETDLLGDEIQPLTRTLDRVRAAGGVAFMARDCRDVLRELDRAKAMQ